MDLELVIWILIFVGGYCTVLGYLFWVALWRKAPPGDRTSAP
jgi:hypothetical protein